MRGYRKVERREEAKANTDTHHERSCSYYWDDEGFLVVAARLSPEDGLLFINAHEAARLDVPAPNPEGDEDVYEDTRRTHADALVELSRRALAFRAAGAPAAAEVVIHADARLLGPDFEEAARDGSILSRVGDGPHLPPETIQRLVCDGPTRVLSELDGEPLNIGRKSRRWTWPMRVAIHVRDGGCFWPGCTAVKGNDIHHIDWWSRGGETSIDNGIEACRTHHRALHEGGYRLERQQGGGFAIFRADGTRVADVPPIAPPALPIETVMPGIDPKASSSRWQNEKLDLSWITALMFHNKAVADASATKAAGQGDTPTAAAA